MKPRVLHNHPQTPHQGQHIQPIGKYRALKCFIFNGLRAIFTSELTYHLYKTLAEYKRKQRMKKKSVKIKTPTSPRVLLTPVKRKYNFVPGVSGNPAGRKKGSKNKFTTLKDAFINAFKRIGGEDALVEYCTPASLEVKNKKGEVVRVIDFSSERKKEFFKMIVPMLPKEVAVTGADGAPLPSQVPVIIFQDAPKENETNDKK